MNWRMRTVFLAVALLAASRVSATTDSPETSILGRAATAILKAEPKWRYSEAICTCPPLMDEQLGVAVGTWYHLVDHGRMPTACG